MNDIQTEYLKMIDLCKYVKYFDDIPICPKNSIPCYAVNDITKCESVYDNNGNKIDFEKERIKDLSELLKNINRKD